MLLMWHTGAFGLFGFICLLLCVGRCTGHGMHVRPRGQLSGVRSFLPPSVLGMELRSLGLGSKRFYPLSHPASPVFNILTVLATFPHESYNQSRLPTYQSVWVCTRCVYLRCCTIAHILLSCWWRPVFFLFYSSIFTVLRRLSRSTHCPVGMQIFPWLDY